MEYIIIITFTGLIMGRISKGSMTDPNGVTIRNPRFLYNAQNKKTGETSMGYSEMVGTPVEMVIPAFTFPMYEPMDQELISNYIRTTTGLYTVN